MRSNRAKAMLSTRRSTTGLYAGMPASTVSRRRQAPGLRSRSRASVLSTIAFTSPAFRAGNRPTATVGSRDPSRAAVARVAGLAAHPPRRALQRRGRRRPRARGRADEQDGTAARMRPPQFADAVAQRAGVAGQRGPGTTARRRRGRRRRAAPAPGGGRSAGRRPSRSPEATTTIHCSTGGGAAACDGAARARQKSEARSRRIGSVLGRWGRPGL